MKQIPLDDLLIDAEIDDNEVDELFSQLECFEPPIDMVADIMRKVSQLPQPKPLSRWHDFDFFELNTDEVRFC